MRKYAMAKLTKYDWLNPNPWGGHVKIANLVGRDKMVLDVGCATGLLDMELKKNGNIVYGIEMDPKQAEAAKAVCEKVFIGNIENIQLDLPKKFFDVILFADILEHLRQPDDVLIKMKDFLKDDGFMVISLPNIAHISIRRRLLLGSFEYGDLGILDRTHLRFFTLKTAKELIDHSGLKIISMDITIPRIPRLNSSNKRYSHLFKLYYSIASAWRTGLAVQFIFKLGK
jgi:2-polyprenyl-3-methyl-5-hydroxy-6-metoxy-1,4-benzoquinol methylase